jgi:threonine synthase
LCLNEIPASNSMPRMVLVATSGDTGGAVAAAFNELTKFPVAILYPSGRISPRQEKQLTVWGKQVHAFSVAGSFDDCQRVVKQAFASEWWRRHFQLISANSINLGRLLPQMACFAYASLRYQRQHGTDPGLIIPTGNAGNSAAGIWARKLGFPIRKVILAHNANQGVRDYFETGVWKSRPTVATLANAMDVAEPSNFERLLDLYPKLEDLKGVAEAFSIDDEQIRASIQQEWSSHQRVWCPHSAVAMRVRSLLQGGDWIVTATAHPAKFETILEPLLKMKIDVPAPLQTLLSRPSHSTSIQPDLPSLQAAISKTVRPQ